jgi:coenzyme F420-reducing hydrogenase gamma subunit
MARPKLAVFKFASCDGCQLSLLDCEDELLAVAEAVEIAYFLEARTQQIDGPYDVGLVEGSVTTQHDVERIKSIRKQCKFLITIGACATAGGIQALRNWVDVGEFVRQVYAHPEYIRTLETSTPIADHVVVDFELRGCPISKHQLLSVLSALLHGRKPSLPNCAVCVECKRQQTVCVAVAQGGRVRRDLPGVQPRVLWLLRSPGTSQPGQPCQLLRHQRNRARAPAAFGTQFQRLCAGVP